MQSNQLTYEKFINLSCDIFNRKFIEHIKQIQQEQCITPIIYDRFIYEIYLESIDDIFKKFNIDIKDILKYYKDTIMYIDFITFGIDTASENYCFVNINNNCNLKDVLILKKDRQYLLAQKMDIIHSMTDARMNIVLLNTKTNTSNIIITYAFKYETLSYIQPTLYNNQYDNYSFEEYLYKIYYYQMLEYSLKFYYREMDINYRRLAARSDYYRTYARYKTMVKYYIGAIKILGEKYDDRLFKMEYLLLLIDSLKNIKYNMISAEDINYPFLDKD